MPRCPGLDQPLAFRSPAERERRKGAVRVRRVRGDEQVSDCKWVGDSIRNPARPQVPLRLLCYKSTSARLLPTALHFDFHCRSHPALTLLFSSRSIARSLTLIILLGSAMMVVRGSESKFRRNLFEQSANAMIMSYSRASLGCARAAQRPTRSSDSRPAESPPPFRLTLTRGDPSELAALAMTTTVSQPIDQSSPSNSPLAILAAAKARVKSTSRWRPR